MAICIVPIIYRLSTCSMGGHRICAGMAIKTNTLIVPFAPAGANDITARLASERLTRALGQPVVVEIAPAPRGTIGI